MSLTQTYACQNRNCPKYQLPITVTGTSMYGMYWEFPALYCDCTSPPCAVAITNHNGVPLTYSDDYDEDEKERTRIMLGKIIAESERTKDDPMPENYPYTKPNQ